MFGPIEIPNKSSFKINEVCALTGVKSYVLRFWESEFSEIAPMTSSSGQKLYEHRDIEAILLVKKLLFVDKLTIERAKAEMKLLMPREFLVESGFNENFSFDEIEDQDDATFQRFENSVDHENAEVIPFHIPLHVPLHTPHNNPLHNPLPIRESMTKRVLIETDFQKLMMAKSKLKEILNITESLHNKNHWS